MGRRVDVQNASTRAGSAYAQALAKIDAAGICPFCPGQEDKTPPEILAYRPSDGPAARRNMAGWSRVKCIRDRTLTNSKIHGQS